MPGATPAGRPGGSPGSRRSPLTTRTTSSLLAAAPTRDLDERLLLGASEALAFLSRGQFQWSGVWYMHADAQLGPLETDLRLIRRAARRGLCDDRRVLVVTGWEDGHFQLRAFLGASSGEVAELPVDGAL